MIEVKDLTKVYVNGKNKIKALNSVSFKLPDKGLVFVIGKSGSGKSTLLNMLGALDDMTSGDVIVNNVSYANMTNKQLDLFRNNYLGIIYQNYNLFESESVIANIKVGTDSLGIHVTDEKIRELLKELDLEEQRDKRVNELSGGQKQRVAIARALVRSPQFILADEPTGNLDTKTAKIIFDILKKVSEETLIIVISHDIKSAHEYADRIIRLSDGEVVEDLIRNSKRKSKLDKDFVYIDEDDEINEQEIEEINKAIEEPLPKLKKRQRAFIDFNGEVQSDNEPLHMRVKHTNFKKVAKTSLTILRHNKFSLVLTIALSILMVSMLTLSSSFIAFKGEIAIADAASVRDVKCLSMKKGYSLTGTTENLKRDYFIEINDEDEAAVRKERYDGNIFKIYNASLPLSGTHFSEVILNTSNDYEKFYLDVGLGTVVCNEQYVRHVFGENYEILAGSLSGLEDTTKLVVSDYFADSLLYHRLDLRSDDPSEPYKNIIDVSLNSRFTFGAIMKTNYKEKFKKYYDMFMHGEEHPEEKADIKRRIGADEDFQIFEDDCNSYLGFAYALNPNFAEDYKDELGYAFTGNAFWTTKENPETKDFKRFSNSYYFLESDMVTDNNVMMNVKNYNALFGTKVEDKNSQDFSEKTLYIYNFGFEQDTSQEARHTSVIHIIDVFETSNNTTFLASKELVREFTDYTMFAYGYHFDKVLDSYKVYEALHDRLFYSIQDTYEAVFNAIDVINIFSRIFLSIFTALLAILVLILVTHSLRMMKREKYRFGVYKSLGYSNKYLGASVAVANLFTMLFIFVASFLISYALSFIANYLLQVGFFNYYRNKLYRLIRLLIFRFDYALYFNLITFGIFIFTTLIPLLKIRKVKPNNIIRNAE